MQEEALNELKHALDETNDELRSLRQAIQGDSYGQIGIIKQLQKLQLEQERLGRIVDAMERDDKRRVEEFEKREQKRDKFQAWVYTLMAAIISGVVINILVIYFNGISGG